MDARTWLGLEPTHNPHRWFLPVAAGISTGGGNLFGGCALGAAIAALEGTAERPIVWATAQYLSFARLGSVVDIDVTLAVTGRQTTQARAVCHVGGAEIITVNGALGSRSFPTQQQFPEAPSVRPPQECPVRERTNPTAGTIDSRLEQRWALPLGAEAPAPLAPGRVAVWARMPELLEPSGASFAVLGDYIPMGIGFIHGGDTRSTSLDNTLRVMNPQPSDWYLLDINVDGLRNGFGHGVIHIWSEDLALCAIGSQSCIVRPRT